MTHPIAFLSDFGYRNEWVGICHAVINKVAPESQVIDLSHGVPPLDVRAGALLLADSLPYLRHEPSSLRSSIRASAGTWISQSRRGRPHPRGPRQRAARSDLARG